MSEGSEAPYIRRPSTVAQFAAQVAQWLREDPTISAVEILHRAQALGYHGGKSALYELVRRVRTLDESPAGSRQLVVVAPDREHLYNFFKRAFEGNATVQIIMDRRVERPASPEPPAGARRQRNRRSIQRTDGLLRAIGWTIVRLRGPKIRRNPAS